MFGVRGWVKVFSYTSPRVNVVRYSPWYLRQDGGEAIWRVVAGKAHGDGVVVSLAGVDDREAAAALIGAEIEVDRATLGPEIGSNEAGRDGQKDCGESFQHRPCHRESKYPPPSQTVPAESK